MAEVVSYAKANPSKLKWGSQGFGTAPHLLAEMFKLETGVNIIHVPYRGTGPLLNAILAGEVQIIADPSTTSLPYIQAGKLRPIAIASNVRDPKLPNVPTVVEAGFPKLQSPFWHRLERRAASLSSSTVHSVTRLRRRKRARGSTHSAPKSKSVPPRISIKCLQGSARSGPRW
jgi:hypothetical protein